MIGGERDGMDVVDDDALLQVDYLKASYFWHHLLRSEVRMTPMTTDDWRCERRKATWYW